ncbi:MAG: hypothetical protein ACNS61_09800 [Candidatus Wenzhouxiangella sp. M2_3B_020]
MNTTLTGRFDDVAKAKTAREEMIAFGIPREKINIDEDDQEIKVIIPEEESRQIREVFKTHGIDLQQ